MIKIIFFVAVVLFFLGPLRRPFFSNWRFTIPLTIGALVGFFSAFLFVRYGAPPFFLLIGPILGMSIIGGELKDSFDKFFKK